MRALLGMMLLAAPAVAGEPAYSWRSSPNDTDRAYLYLDGKQVGGWCYHGKHYRTFDGTTWGAPTNTAPTRPPAQRPTIVMTQPSNPPLAFTRPSTPAPRLRGPLRVRAATVMTDAVLDTTMRIFEEIPGAILDSILKGNAKLTFGSGPPRP